jgi:hypothetical protein
MEINQLALVHVNGVRGVHPCLVLNPTVTVPRFIRPHITRPPSNLLYRWMASKSRGIAMWCGGTGIPAALSSSIWAAAGNGMSPASARDCR